MKEKRKTKWRRKQALPNTLSELLTVAIRDAEALNRSRYLPNYSAWHSPTAHGKCEVCLAGAVMAGTLELPHTEHLYPDEKLHPEYLKLKAIDNMRYGSFVSAAKLLGLDANAIPFKPISEAQDALWYRSFNNWHEFDVHVKSLKKARDILQRVGL